MTATNVKGWLLDTHALLWMNLQLDYDFMRAEREKGEAIRREVQPSAA